MLSQQHVCLSGLQLQKRVCLQYNLPQSDWMPTQLRPGGSAVHSDWLAGQCCSKDCSCQLRSAPISIQPESLLELSMQNLIVTAHTIFPPDPSRLTAARKLRMEGKNLTAGDFCTGHFYQAARYHSLLISRESRGPASYSFTTLIKHVPDIQLIYSGFEESYF